MLKISGGKSEKDRISFYTTKFRATAIRKNNGEIYYKYDKRKLRFSKNDYIIIAIWFIILILKSFVFIPQIRDNTMHIIWYFIPTFYYIFITLFSIMHLRITGGKELLKNHAAEHMVFTAYRKLKRIPTITETQIFSRISKYCGITLYSALITGQIIGFIVFFYGNFKIPEILLVIIPLIFANAFPFNILGKFFQFFTTSKPDKENIELALAALKSLIDFTSSITDRFIKEHFNEIIENKKTIDIDYDSFFNDWKLED